MKRILANLICLTFALLFGAAMSAHAQSYDLSWYKIAGGGGTSTGSTYSLSGTIGQPDAGHLSGGTYTIDGGFWGIFSVVQTPGAPFLVITPSGQNVLLSWSSASTGFTLQTNSNLATTNWHAISLSTNNAGGSNTVTVPVVHGDLFFRLKSP